MVGKPFTDLSTLEFQFLLRRLCEYRRGAPKNREGFEGNTSSSIVHRQTGQVDFSLIHGLRHSLWISCLQCGSRIVFASFSNGTRQMWHSSCLADLVFLNLREFFWIKRSAANFFLLNSFNFFAWIRPISPCMWFRRSICRRWHTSLRRLHVDRSCPFTSREIAI